MMGSEITVSKDLIDFLNSLPEPRLVLGTDYKIIASNTAYQKIFGEGKPLKGKHCYEVSHHYLKPCDQQGESCPLKVAKETKSTHRVFHIHHTPRGREHVDVELTPILNEEGQPAFYIETLRNQNHHLKEHSPDCVAGKSPWFTRVLGLVERSSASDTPVVLLGESGTGKEVMAHLLHKKSKRNAGSFIIVDCSGLTETLFESEMFGHEKGSFTGAYNDKKGLVEMANGGTLFLDEVGDIPLSQQVKLLRLLESNTYRKVGGLDVKRTNFRLISATHRDLKKMVQEGTFRQDLYYRINAFPIHIPSLRERSEDILILAEYFQQKLSPTKEMVFEDSAKQFLQSYSFPGNIRELRNMIDRAILLCDSQVITKHHLIPDQAFPDETESISTNKYFRGDILPLDELESMYLQWAVSESNDSKRDLAEKLGLTPRTLYRKLKEIKSQPLE